MLEEQRKREGKRDVQKTSTQDFGKNLGRHSYQKIHSKKITKSSNNAQNHIDLSCGSSTCTVVQVGKKSWGNFVFQKQRYLNAYKMLEWLGTCALKFWNIMYY